MKHFYPTILFAFYAVSASAAVQTVTLSVPTMDCPVCPITVKKALLKVRGVSQASVNFEKRLAMVTFEDSQTGIEALMLSTKNAGYPSTWLTTSK